MNQPINSNNNNNNIKSYGRKKTLESLRMFLIERVACSFLEFKIMILPSLSIYNSLVDVKTSSNDFVSRQGMHYHLTRKRYFLSSSVSSAETRSSHLFMKIKLFNKLLEKASYITVNRFKSFRKMASRESFLHCR